MLKARTGGYWPVRAVNRYEGLSGDFPAAQHVPQRTQEQQPAAQGKAPADPQGGQQGGGKQGRDLRQIHADVHGGQGGGPVAVCVQPVDQVVLSLLQIEGRQVQQQRQQYHQRHRCPGRPQPPEGRQSAAAQQTENRRQPGTGLSGAQANDGLGQHLPGGISDDDGRKPRQRNAAVRQLFGVEEIHQQPGHAEHGQQCRQQQRLPVPENLPQLAPHSALAAVLRDGRTGLPAQEKGTD